jgi:hypothetical protein
MHPQVQTAKSAQAAVEGVHPRAEAIAQAMIDNYQSCDIATLCRLGFTKAEIDQHHDTASSLARALFLRDDTAPDYDRAARIASASQIILNLCPSVQTLAASLQARGFAKPEIDDILDEALARAGNTFGVTAGQPDVGE